MTNAEKYLKDGVESKEIWHKYQEFLMNNDKTENACTFVEFMEEQAKPQLTEDERVILRNIREFNYISRNEDNDLYLLFKYSETYTETHYCNMFRHLFQFIKERRRI